MLRFLKCQQQAMARTLTNMISKIGQAVHDQKASMVANSEQPGRVEKGGAKRKSKLEAANKA